MSSELIGTVHPFAPEPKVADRSTIRNFVKDISEITEKVKEAQMELKEVISSHERVQEIDDQIKKLREERKEVITDSAVIQGYVASLNEILEEKQQIIDTAKDNGVPKNEIDTAIKMLKRDIDVAITTMVYSEIADLI